ncbi:RNA polymerase I enhancer binding protein [Mitosporidium daphniae]|uniref:Myb-like domain-containing protein n=1 Tax=Mitosporidium daphniae TaxID=1485682 RepID=A0A098VW56_9MICR|nr:uncharacterized protein DI09_106p10 [Mitosporidium daphniae]KGG53177.1 hypothetical protein DI09_106p10 [Mitosporidium daphniae]|eukprot:XP_013239613.1 uncharacterized protein DI09_106p10 [Mitosporidium daphniae]
MSLADKYIEAIQGKRHVTFADEQTDWSPIQRWLSIKDVKKTEEELGITCRRGKFSSKENECIREFVQSYFKNREEEYQLFIDQLVTRKNKMRDTIGNIFVEATKALNNGRPVFAVYDHIRRLYHPNNYTGWTPTEDEHLKRLVSVHGPNWEQIGQQLQKLSINCRDRYKIIRLSYISGKIFVLFVGKWSEEEVERLKSIISELTRDGMRPARGLWIVVSERMQTRSVLQCFDKWTSLSYKKTPPVHFWSRFEDFKLISAIYERCYAEESEIIWRNLTDPSYSARTPTACRSRWLVLKKRVPRRMILTGDFDSALEELLRQLHPGSSDWESIPE